MNDTPTILAAIDLAVEHLGKFGGQEWRASKTLRSLRASIEKEREFVEAAMEVAALYSEPGIPWDRFARAYRSLISEKPPEEGEK